MSTAASDGWKPVRPEKVSPAAGEGGSGCWGSGGKPGETARIDERDSASNQMVAWKFPWHNSRAVGFGDV